jgi:hypothetical protein
MVTRTRTIRSNSVPRENKLVHRMSKPRVIAGPAASFACLLAGGTLGIVFGTAVAASMGSAGYLRPTEVASASDALKTPVQPESTVQSIVHDQVGPADSASIPQTKPSVVVPVSDTASVAPTETTATTPSSRTSAPVVQPDSVAFSKPDGNLPSPSVPIFRIEGDATVVDYDVVAGTIEVRDGRTFLLAGAGSQTESNQWQDYVGNVHYSCDQGGICTLSRGGAIVPSARLLIT